MAEHVLPAQAPVCPQDQENPEDIARDLRAIDRIDAVPSLLRVICQTTGMGFAAVARVSDQTWTACAVHDDIDFGLQPGGQLDLHTTLCKESRLARQPVVIDQASKDPAYAQHHTPRLYGIESYISVPIVLPDGNYFGNLCAIDPRPAKVSEPRIVTLFELFAELIAVQLESERQRERERAAFLDQRAAGELREQFIAVLSHDLRNPLQAIASCAHVLQARAGDAQSRSMAERIVKNTRRMSALIDDTMDLTRVRLGSGMGAVLQPATDLAAALGDVVSELRDANPDRLLVAQIDVPGGVVCDKGRLQQLLSNLLANALVHGSVLGPVQVHVAVEAGQLVMGVSNQGDPIPQAVMAQIFEPYRRGQERHANEGLGLGLYICAQIAKAHGGTLDVQSAASGTTFTARLPVGGPHKAAAVAAAVAAAAAAAAADSAASAADRTRPAGRA